MAWRRIGNLRGPPGGDGPPGRDGIGIPGERGEMGRQGLSGKDGKDGVGERGPPGLPGESIKGERGERGAPGELPRVKAWTDRIHYEGDLVTHKGALWQAACDTAKEPGSSADWSCIAAAGAEGRGLRIRGVYREGVEYHALDVVTLDRAWLVAKCDAPGPCPGPNWLAGPIGKRGDKGLPGERGPQGLKGENGKDGQDAKESVIDFKVDPRSYSLILIMSDGSIGGEISLRALFDQYDLERKGA